MEAVTQKPEEWRSVVGFESFYEVSSHGRIRRHINYKIRNRYDRSIPGRILITSIGTHGYRYVLFTIDGNSIPRLVHRLVAEAFIEPCPEGKEVNHIDSDRLNNHATNLQWVTRKENIQHGIKVGRIRPQWLGTLSFKLTTDQINEIRMLAANGESQLSIAQKSGINRAYVSQIVSRKRRQLVAQGAGRE